MGAGITDKDIVLAIFAADVSLMGMILLVETFYVTIYLSLPGAQRVKMKDVYMSFIRLGAAGVIQAYLFSLLALAWMVWGFPLWIVIITFFWQIGSVAILAILTYVLVRLPRGDEGG